MQLKVFYIIAESQMAELLRAAAAEIGSDPRCPVEFQVDGLLLGNGPLPADALQRGIGEADILLLSMLNTDRESRQIEVLLRDRRPPVTAVFTSQPELMAYNRVGPLDAMALFADRRLARELASRLKEYAGPLPALPHVLLAAAPRLEPALGQEKLGDLWAYARAALYWQQGSPSNLRALLLHLAACHPAVNREQLPPIPAPELYPEVALWHPRAPALFTDLDAYLRWYAGYWKVEGPAGHEHPPRVGLVLFRQYVTSQGCDHYAAVVHALERRGIQVIPGFGGLDNRVLVRRFFRPAGIELLLNLTGFNLVGAMGNPQPQAAVELLKELDVPYLVALPLLFQSSGEWRQDPAGLAPVQTALQVVMPELEGGLEPRVYAGRDEKGRLQPVPDGVDLLARRVSRWIRLRRLPPGERRVALVIFSFPPDKGSVGSAAYLDVFASLHRILVAMAEQGYRVDVPATPDALRRAVLGSDTPSPCGRSGLSEAVVAARLDAAAYRRLVPYHRRLERQWGPAPGDIDVEGDKLCIRGRAFGNVFVGVQPSFGYEGDPLRLLLSPDAAPSHSFAAFYTWLQEEWGADAIVHVGTHGALEFMPGKQVGLSPDCYPFALIGEVPHLYFYAVNNPSEATIAKRRGAAACISYLTPPLAAAGLYRELSDLKGAVAAYRQAASPLSRQAAWSTVLDLVARSGLHADLRTRGIPWPEEGTGSCPPDEPLLVDKLSDYLHELETELIPQGLHVAGRTLGPEEQRQFLEAVLAHPRPEEGVPSLDEFLGKRHESPGKACPDASDPSLRRAVLDRLVAGDPEGAWEAIGGPGTEPPEAWRRLAAFSRDFLERLQPSGEIPRLLAALDGRYIPPSPAGEPARRPEVLPTGRNPHALDPQKVPSPVAQRAGRDIAEQLLQRVRSERGRYPETIALVLWGTDNIKTEGEGLAQALHLMGVEVAPDSRGRMCRLRLIPLAELGRPRIDVVVTVSGIFRDIFPNAMALLNEAARLAACADEPEEQNFLRKHALAFSRRFGISLEEAACRVFSNRPGQYGTGVNVAVDSSEWETSHDLGRLFVERKGFAYGDDGQCKDRRELFAACLETAEAAFQNVDSTEISLSDVDHYFEYLGGLAAAVAASRESPQPPLAYVADSTRGRGRVRSLREALQVETRTRLLNPRWYEKMLAHGYQGVHEVAVRLENTFGWSASADAVDPWAYEQAADTFILDDGMRRQLAQLNPRATHRMAARLLEAFHRGFWHPDPDRQRRLREAFLELEDQVELDPIGGVAR